ncbi:unnamed protein product [Amoebophrya sp. A120]|nr:unnamed protein product [Amoebophrya sp. A120]|eukprot:GSA120T00005717001.1
MSSLESVSPSPPPGNVSENNEYIVALILARGGSKGIPRKNIKPLAGQPLLSYTVTAARKSGVFKRVVVSTDDDEIAAVASSYGAEVFQRSAETASDKASSESAVAEFLLANFPKLVSSSRSCTSSAAVDKNENTIANNGTAGDLLSTSAEVEEPDHAQVCSNGNVMCCLIQATSPLTTAEDFRQSLQLMRKAQADSLVTVVRYHRFFWKLVDAENQLAVPMNYDPARRPRRQDWDGERMENGAFYFFGVARFLQEGAKTGRYNRCCGEKTCVYEMAEDTAAEIDSLTDWDIIEKLVEKRRAEGKLEA